MLWGKYPQFMGYAFSHTHLIFPLGVDICAMETRFPLLRRWLANSPLVSHLGFFWDSSLHPFLFALQ